MRKTINEVDYNIQPEGDLSDADLSGADLTRANLKKATL